VLSPSIGQTRRYAPTKNQVLVVGANLRVRPSGFGKRAVRFFLKSLTAVGELEKIGQTRRYAPTKKKSDIGCRGEPACSPKRFR